MIIRIERFNIHGERKSRFPVILACFWRESISIAVIPDILYRASILGSFRMDPRLQLAGMTAKRLIPATHCGDDGKKMDLR